MLFPNLSRVGSMVGAAAGGGATHRYWRITNFDCSSHDLMIEELQLWTDASTRADTALTSLTPTDAPAFGTVDRLLDGSLASHVEWFPWSAAKTIVWDFVTPKAVTGFKHADRGGGGETSRMLSIRLQYSDDNAAWTTYGDVAVVTSSYDVLSAFIPFV